MFRIKFVGRGAAAGATRIWSRQIADYDRIGECQFIFDFRASSYDWFVVYDDMPRLNGSRRQYHFERLNCPPENTILITSEPSSVRRYPRAFVDQFNYVLSSQEPEFLNHAGHLHQQPGLRWYYGVGQSRLVDLAEMISNPPISKTKTLSAIVSAKAQRHTLHAKRVKFIEELGRLLPSLDRFGHGFRAMDDKSEALDAYRYHIAIENHIAPHHWTEKLADAFLACTHPFYIGAPDIYEYFPEESLVTLPLDDPERSARLIADAISEHAWEKRLSAIMEARKLVIERYGLFQNLASIIPDLALTPHQIHHSNRHSLIESAFDARKRQPVYSLFERVKNVGRFLKA